MSEAPEQFHVTWSRVSELIKYKKESSSLDMLPSQKDKIEPGLHRVTKIRL